MSGAAGPLVATLLLLAGGILAGAPVPAAAIDIPTASSALISRLITCYVFVGGGSGVLISADGLVLTNNHVIDGEDDISVRTADGTTWRTTLLGTDPIGDIALLRIDPQAIQASSRTFAYAEFASEANLITGMPVIAVGNPFGLGDFDDVPTITTGVLGTGRIVRGSYTDALQADAPVNPGNSGGPLFDLQGRLLGINGQIRSRTGFRINSGIGLAVSAVQLHAFLEPLMAANGGYVRHTAMPKGLTLEQTPTGVVITGGGEPTLRAGDRLLTIDGRNVTSTATASGLFSAGPWQSDAQASVLVVRGETQVMVKVPLGRMPIPGHSYHGMSFIEDGGSTIIDHVDPDSPAALVGVAAGDVVTAVGDAVITGKISLLRALIKTEIGDRVPFTVRTKTGDLKTVQVLFRQHP